MAKRKYQVFISSSFVDLKEARQELIMATLKEGHIPFGMEMLKAGPTLGTEVIRENIQKSDVFVVLVGARFGTRTSEHEGSLGYTEQEFEIADEIEKPIIAFLLDDNDYKDVRDKIPHDNKERREEDALLAFREKVKKTNGGSRIVGFFSYGDLSDLSGKYSRSIADCISVIEQGGAHGGWVEGKQFDLLSNRISLDRSVSNNPFFRDFAKRLNRFEKLSKRTVHEQNLKSAAADYFWRRYFAKLKEKEISSIFFESGSSVAYVSGAFIQLIRNKIWFFEEKMNDKIKIRTNNILTYLDFLLQESPWKPMDVRVMPYGPISDDYGATYGTLDYAVEQSAPSPKDSVRKRLPEVSQHRVDEVIEEFLREFLDSGLILMTASGLDIRSAADNVPYPGPHVGSYPNMLLKRVLLSLPYPKVLFLHPEKWGFEFRPHNCHPVCDETFAWDEKKVSSPLAIALATDSRSKQRTLSNELERHGFVDIDMEEPAQGTEGPWSIIAANQKFADFFQVTE